MATVVTHLSGLESSLARALSWTAAWDMTRDGELPARDYLTLVCTNLPAESDINLVTANLRQAQQALSQYADPRWAPTGWLSLAQTAQATLTAAEPGGGLQLAWARAFIAAARDASDLGMLRGWLDGRDVPAGLTIGADLRWELIFALAAAGTVGTDEIAAELDRDRTASGERSAAQAEALVATPEAKAEAWRRITTDDKLPNWRQRALLQGFYHPSQLALTEPYVARYFDVVADIWATLDSDPAQDFVYLGFPAHHVGEATVAGSDAWLADESRPAPLRRLVGEGRDAVIRAIKARSADGATS